MTPRRMWAAAGSALAGGIAVGAVRAARAMRALYPAPVDGDEGIGTAPAHDERRLTAAVLLDHSGAEVSDFLLPYELLAASGAFNVYATAPASRPATLTGGLDVLPHLSYPDFDRLPVDRADLVVVPHLPRPDRRVIDWIRSQAGAGATILSICTGAGVAAAAAVFDGRTATAHWGDLGKFGRRYPQVRWVRGVRYVDDGDVAASAGITAGIDATLHLIRRLVDTDAMHRAAAAIGYTDLRYLDDPTTKQYRVAPSDLIAPFTAAYGRRPDIGVLLRHDVDETAVAAAMDTYGATFAAGMRTLSRGCEPIRTRHGLTLLPRGASEAVRTDRVLAPRTCDEEPSPAGAMALPSSGPPYGAIGEALDDLARHAGRPIARFAAKRLEYRNTPIK